jgi:hypothetical protein
LEIILKDGETGESKVSNEDEAQSPILTVNLITLASALN